MPNRIYSDIHPPKYNWCRKVLVKLNSRYLCGVFPFQLPWWVGKTPCCKNHDIGYDMFSEEAICRIFELQIPPDDVRVWLTEKYYVHIKNTDYLFFCCMREHARNSSIWTRWYRERTTTAFKVIIENNGWNHWLTHTVELAANMLEENKGLA